MATPPNPPVATPPVPAPASASGGFSPYKSQDEADRAFIIASSIAIHGEPIPIAQMDTWLAYKAFNGAHMTLRNLWATKPAPTA